MYVGIIIILSPRRCFRILTILSRTQSKHQTGIFYPAKTEYKKFYIKNLKVLILYGILVPGDNKLVLTASHIRTFVPTTLVNSVHLVTTVVFLYTDPAAAKSNFLSCGRFVFTYIVGCLHIQTFSGLSRNNSHYMCALLAAPSRLILLVSG